MIMSKVTSIVGDAIKSTTKVRLVDGALNDLGRFLETWCSVMALEKFSTRLGDYRLDEFLVTEQLKEAIMPRYVSLAADDKLGLVNLLDHEANDSLMNPNEFINFQAKLLSWYKKEASFNNLSLADSQSLVLSDVYENYAMILNDRAFSKQRHAMCLPLNPIMAEMIEDDNIGWILSEDTAVQSFVYSVIDMINN